jgi:hypothetical protein
MVGVNPADFKAHDTFKLDITRLANEWTPPGEPNAYWNGIDMRIQGDGVSLEDLDNDNSWWSPANGDNPITAAWNYAAVRDMFGPNPGWVQFIFAVNAQHYLNPVGHFYLDNARLTGVPEPATIALLGLGGLALLRKKR